MVDHGVRFDAGGQRQGQIPQARFGDAVLSPPGLRSKVQQRKADAQYSAYLRLPSVPRAWLSLALGAACIVAAYFAWRQHV